MADLYQSALRSCYMSLHLAGRVPNAYDPDQDAFRKVQDSASTRLMLFIVAGVPLLFYIDQKLLLPRFPEGIFKRGAALGIFSAAYVLCCGLLNYSEKNDEMLTKLAWRYESEMLTACPDIRKFTRTSNPYSESASKYD